MLQLFDEIKENNSTFIFSDSKEYNQSIEFILFDKLHGGYLNDGAAS